MSALGKLVVELSLNYAAYTQGLDKSDQAALKFAQNTQRTFDAAARSTKDYFTGMAQQAALAVTAYVSVRGAIDGLQKSIDTLEKLDDMSQKTGASVENLSKLQKVVQAFGGDFGMVDSAIFKLSKGMATVDSDTNKVNKALKALGISAKDANGNVRDGAEVLIEISKKLQAYSDGAGKAAISTDLFTKGLGGDMLPVMNDVAEHVDRFTGVSTDAALAATAFKDQLGLLSIEGSGLFDKISVELLPAFTRLTKAMVDGAKEGGILNGVWHALVGSVSDINDARDVQIVNRLEVIKDAMDFILERRKAWYASPMFKEADLQRLNAEALTLQQELATLQAISKEKDKPVVKPPLKYTSGTDGDAKAAAQKIEALNEASRKFLETLKVETTAVGASVIQTKLLAAAKQAAITPSQELGMAIMTQAQAWASLTQFQEEAVAEFAVLQEREDAFFNATNAIEEYSRATDLANDAAAFEIELMGKSGVEREIAIEQRRVELDLKKQILAINDQVTNDDDRDALIEQAEAIGESAKAGARLTAVARNTNEEWTRMWSTVEQTGKLAFVNLLGHGTSSMKAIGQSIKASIIDLLYQITVRKWIINIGTSISGSLMSGVANAGMDAGMSRLLSGFGLSTVAGSTSATASSLTGSIASIGQAISSGFSTLTGAATEAFTAFATSALGVEMGLGTAASSGTAVIGGAGTALGGTGVATEAGLTALGSSMAAVAGPLAGAMAGFTIGKLIAGNKEIFGLSGTSTAAIGAMAGLAVGAFFGPIGMAVGALIGGALGGLTNALFGHGPKKYTGPQTVVGDFTSAGFAGDLQQTWKKKGGLLVKSKYGVDHEEMSPILDMMLDSLVFSTSAAFKELASVAGNADRSLTGFSFSINREISTKEQEKQLITDLSNAIGAHLIPELLQVQQENEQLADTALRVRKELSVTNQLLDLTGLSFGAVGLASIGLSDRLVQLMGGVDSAASSLATFYGAFYTGAEQSASGWRLLNAEMTRIGVQSLPTTRDGFRALVEAQDLSTYAGQEMFAQLMSLAPAFAALTDEAIKAKAAVTLLTTDSFSTLVDYTRYIRLAANAGMGPKPDEIYQEGTMAAGSLGSSNAQLLVELRQLRAEQQAGDIAIAQNTAAIANVLSRWEGDGMPDIRDIAA